MRRCVGSSLDRPIVKRGENEKMMVDRLALVNGQQLTETNRRQSRCQKKNATKNDIIEFGNFAN